MYGPIRFLAAGGLLVALAGSGCSGHSRSGKGTSSPGTTGPSVSRKLAPAPTTCPGPKPRLEQVTPSLGQVMGRKPAWADFGTNPKTGMLRLRGAHRTRYGWREKVLWLVAYRRKGVIRLRGHDVMTGTSMRFDVVNSGAGVTRVGLLNHGEPGALTGPGEPKQFPSHIYFPAAGCYALSASWKGGSWKVVLGLGQ